jgi:uncharacterized membrane protein
MDERHAESVGLAEVNALRREGLVSTAQYLDAVYFCRKPDYWARWARMALLALGAGHLLAGIIYFFAYNWDDLTPVAKFALLQGGIVVSVVLALIVKPDRPAGQVLLIAATVLVGALLAVIGQVYQPGADAYGLFVTWTLLVFPWVLASRSAAHWLIWLVIAYAAANLYAYQVLILDERLTSAELNCALSVAFAIVLVAREGALSIGMQWLEARWTRAIPAIAALLVVFWFAVSYVLGWDGDLLATVVFLIMLAGMFAIYSRVLPDFSVVAICVGFAALFLMAVGGRILNEVLGFDIQSIGATILSLLLLVLWCSALTTAAVKFLASIRGNFANGDAND